MRPARLALRRMSVDASVEKVTIRGQGVVPLGDLPPIALRHALPGQRLRVDVECVLRVLPRRQLPSRRLKVKSVSVVRPSPSSAIPRCKLFGHCNGCIWQHAEYAAQVRWKESVLQALLLDPKLAAPIYPMKASPQSYNYRSKFEFSLASQAFHLRNDPRYGVGEEFAPSSLLLWQLTPPLSDAVLSEYESHFREFVSGLHPNGAVLDRLVGLDSCHLIPEVGNSVYRASLAALQRIWPASEIPRHLTALILRFGWVPSETESPIQTMVQLETRALAPPEALSSFPEALLEALSPELHSSVRSIVTLPNTVESRRRLTAARRSRASGPEEEEEEPEDPSLFRNYRHVRVLHGSDRLEHQLGPLRIRFGPASFLQPNLFQMEPLYRVVSEVLSLRGDEVVWDLFCGTGTIGLFLASQARSVVGVDVVETAVEDAVENAKRNALFNCRFHLLDLMTAQGLHALSAEPPNVVVVDPNRPGLGATFCSALKEIHPETICYISCNPESQKLDLLRLASDYKVILHQPVDMLPHTPHIENVTLLRALS